MAEKTFTITCTMEERWIDDFMSFLNYMQRCGNLGHSCLVGFYADGDGDFRPRFVSDVKYTKVTGFETKKIPERMFDAG